MGLRGNGVEKTNQSCSPQTHPTKFLIDSSINSGIIIPMTRVEEIVALMQQNPKGIRFHDLCRVCDFYFGEARQSGSSHRVYKTPWHGDPRVNIQNDKGSAKAYQVRQVLKAIVRLKGGDNVTE